MVSQRLRRIYASPPLPGLGETLEIAAGEQHHLAVLRLAAGAPLLLLDGEGSEVEASLLEGGRVRVTGTPRHARPAAPLHVLLALTKAAAFDTALRMCTEGGATHLHPVLTRRCVAKEDKGDRWERITLAAAKQCGRADLPEISPLRSLTAAIAALPAGLLRYVAVPGGAPEQAPEGGAVVLIGPEGGLDPAEVRAAFEAGFAPLSLGTWIFRADTAAAVAVALLAPR